jgi:peptide/nickel transport system permease protein
VVRGSDGLGTVSKTRKELAATGVGAGAEETSGADRAKGLRPGRQSAALRGGGQEAGYYRRAFRRLCRDRVALAFGALFLLVLAACLCAPLYSRWIAHIGPDANDVLGTVRVGGHLKDVVSTDGIPIGPTWHARFLLGADSNGRDVAVRLLYGGRTSIEIGAIATAIMVVLGTAIGVAAGYYRGAADAVL